MTPPTPPLIPDRAAANRELDMLVHGWPEGVRFGTEHERDDVGAALKSADVSNEHGDPFAELAAYNWNGTIYHLPDDYVLMWDWDNRKGREWEADMMAHVHAWRREPTDWFTDAQCRVLREHLKERVNLVHEIARQIKLTLPL